MICLGISIFLWLLVHLSKDYLYTAEYRLNYTQVPWNMRLASSSDSVLILTIRMQGYEFFSEQFFRHRKRECDVSLRGLKVNYNGEEAHGYMLTKRIARTITEQTSYPLEILSMAPDTIFFMFERKTLRRMVPVKPGNLNVIGGKTDTIRPHPESIRGNTFRSEISRKKKNFAKSE